MPANSRPLATKRRHGSADGEKPYARLTAAQLVDIRSRAPKPRGKLVRKADLSGVTTGRRLAPVHAGEVLTRRKRTLVH